MQVAVALAKPCWGTYSAPQTSLMGWFPTALQNPTLTLCVLPLWLAVPLMLLQAILGDFCLWGSCNYWI